MAPLLRRTVYIYQDSNTLPCRTFQCCFCNFHINLTEKNQYRRFSGIFCVKLCQKRNGLPQMGTTFLKFLSDFPFRSAIISMLGWVIWPGNLRKKLHKSMAKFFQANYTSKLLKLSKTVSNTLLCRTFQCCFCDFHINLTEKNQY